MLKAARDDDSAMSKLAMSTARSILRGRRFLKRNEGVSLAELDSVSNNRLSELRVDDAKVALSLFDSDISEIRSSANAVLRTILSKKGTGEQPESRREELSVPREPGDAKRYWMERIREEEISGVNTTGPRPRQR
jgi:hypothetical protein